MSRGIPEGDWEVFRELQKLALERLCEKALAEAKAEIERPDKSSHARYLRLFVVLQDRDREIARGFNDLRRSTALMQIGIIHSMGLWTAEEIGRFSPVTLQAIEMFASERA